MTNGILLTRHNQEIAKWSPDPFPRGGWGLGTRLAMHMHMAAALASCRSLLTLLAQTGVEIHSSPFVGTPFLVL